MSVFYYSAYCAIASSVLAQLVMRRHFNIQIKEKVLWNR